MKIKRDGLKELVELLDQRVREVNKDYPHAPSDIRDLFRRYSNVNELSEKIENYIPDLAFRGELTNTNPFYKIPAEDGHESGFSAEELASYVFSEEYG